jgi:hypothetical protein
MLVLDIGASVKEPPKPAPPKPPADDNDDPGDYDDTMGDTLPNAPGNPSAPTLPNIPVTLDRIMKPGALVSGEAVFPGNQKIQWFLDRSGRVAIHQAPPGFAPSQDEALAFQTALREALMKNGYA